MNRIDQILAERKINQTLRDLYKSGRKLIADENYLNEDMVYQYLILMNVSDEDKDKTLKSFDNGKLSDNCIFGKWINYFDDVDNINVFCSRRWSYFCQFKNGKVDVDNCVKIYVPLNYDHIYEGAKEIFKFMADNNIEHLSKISSIIRFDDVVIRLNSLEDAEKVQNFINKNTYIKKGMIKNNPFAFDNNGVSYSYDGRLSYNFCVASIIKCYINASIVRDIKGNVSVRDGLRKIDKNDFINFINLLSSNLDLMSNVLSNETDNKLFKKVDAYFITNLLKVFLTADSFEDYKNYLNFIFRNDVWGEVANAFQNYESNLELSDILDRVKEKNIKEELFNEFILTTMKKYPLGYDENNKSISGYNFIKGFLCGNINCVTRDRNLRERVRTGLSVDDIEDIVDSKNIPGVSFDDKVYKYIQIIMLNYMIKCTEIRFGSYSSNINSFIRKKDKMYITNKVGGAREIAKTLDGMQIRKLFYSLGVGDLGDYVKNYYDDEKIDKMVDRR